MLKNKKGVFPASYLFWPFSGRCITKNGYYNMLQKVREPMHRCKILSFDNTCLLYAIAQCTFMDYLKLIKC